MIDFFPLSFIAAFLLILVFRDYHFNEQYAKYLGSDEPLEVKVSRLKKTSRYRSGAEDVLISALLSLVINGIFYLLIIL